MRASFLFAPALLSLCVLTPLANGVPGATSTPFDAPESDLPLIPYPREWSATGRELRFGTLRLAPSPAVSGPLRESLVEELADVRATLGIPEAAAGAAALEVRLILDGGRATGRNAEAYTLTMRDGVVTVTAAGHAGFFNALQSLRQLIVKQADGFALPEGEMRDRPAFAVRGVMLDVGRYYLSPELIREIVRRLSRYKINLLHLHLTDDPAWRFQVFGHPELTDAAAHWKTRLPGKFYTQDELRDLVAYAAKLNVRVLPEIDLPGHSAAFAKAVGASMQSPKGLGVVQESLRQAATVFPDPWLHIGSDEVHVSMKSFMPEVLKTVRAAGNQPVVWWPGYAKDPDAIAMCWGENESAGVTLNKSVRHIDCNGFYLDWMDSQSGVAQVFFQQPCEVPEGDDKALGGVMPVWADGALGGERRILEQYPFYPCALTFAERLWRGAPSKRRDLMAKLPDRDTPEGRAFAQFEKRLTWHRDHAFAGQPFAYVRQSDMAWSLIGPFDHRGQNNTAFEPERAIFPEYTDGDRRLAWTTEPAVGGAVHIRHLFAMFNQHRKQYRPDHWPTRLSAAVGTKPGTCYALTYVHSPKEREAHLMLGFNGMWGHSGGYRSARAPEPGSWDFSGGDAWLNDRAIPAPQWSFKSLPWGGWGKGRIENAPLTEEGYFFRPPVKITLGKGWNKLLLRSVAGHWKGDTGECKWFFCAMPVNWDGVHYTEVEGLTFHPGPLPPDALPTTR